MEDLISGALEFDSLALKKTSSGQLFINCPFCVKNGKGIDTKGHLYINPATFKYKCHRCQEAGQDIRVMFPALPYYVGEDEMLDIAKLDLSTNKITLDLDKVSRKIELWDREVMYLEGRKLTSDRILKYDFRVGIDSFRNYVIFPIYDQAGDCVYFVARATSKDAELRYRNPGMMGRLGVLGNYNRALGTEYTFLTEGLFTGLSTGDNFVFQLGTIISNEQAYKTAALNRLLYIPDSDVKIEDIMKNFNTILKYREYAEYVPIDRRRKCDFDDLPYDHKMHYLSKTFLVDGFTINDLPKYIAQFGFMFKGALKIN